MEFGIALAVFVLLVGYASRRYWWPFDKISHIASKHLGTKAAGLSTVSRPFATIDLPNIERALDQIAPNGRRFGVAKGMMPFNMEELGGLLHGNSRIAGIQTQSVEIGPGESIACMVNGLVLVSSPSPAILYVRREEMLGKLEVQAAAVDPDVAEDLLDQIVEACATSSIYRGRIISVECDRVARRGGECMSLRFHTPPQFSEDDLILPDATRKLIERNTIGFFDTLDQMRATGRSVKRGLLLYGRPGTGKTMTAKWISSSVPGLTTLFLSADQLFLIKDCCQMARMLAPAMVVLEDVDLVARDRGKEEDIRSRVTLNQLLNEMDGIADNAGVLFLLTTNRPEDLEHALAARPGRVDQAIEYPLPDADCRKRLFEKYLDGLQTKGVDLGDLVQRTDGAPPAFIEEVVRKALSLAIFEGPSSPLEHRHFIAAFQELLFTGGDLTRKLLGFSESLLDAVSPD
jgi:hypothetical protein